jgi:hypothetical protein
MNMSETNPSESAQTTKVPPNEINDSVVEIKFLAQSWLDDFEKAVFDGKTVNQLLNQPTYE